jgi:hypothetical protein
MNHTDFFFFSWGGLKCILLIKYCIYPYFDHSQRFEMVLGQDRIFFYSNPKWLKLVWHSIKNGLRTLVFFFNKKKPYYKQVAWSKLV